LTSGGDGWPAKKGLGKTRIIILKLHHPRHSSGQAAATLSSAMAAIKRLPSSDPRKELRLTKHLHEH
jgi:hypothetical protein